MRQWLESIYNLGITSELDAEDRRRATLVNQIIFYCGLTPMLMLPLVAAIAEPINVIFISSCGLVLASSLIFSARNNHRMAMFWFSFFASTTVAIGAILFRNSTSDIYLIPAATLPFITLKNKKEAIVVFVINMALFCIVNYSYQYIEPIMDFEGDQREIAYVNGVIMVALMILIVLYQLRKQNDRFEGEIIEQKEIIEEAHKDMVDSIVYAQRIQQAILPPKRKIEQHLPNSFFYFKPKDVVSGDFYWLEQMGIITLFAAADCTGHGVPGAMVSVVCVNALNRSVREFGLTKPSQILNKTRELVIETFEQSDHDVKDGMDISLCAYNQDAQTLEWAGANNPLYHVKKVNDSVNENEIVVNGYWLCEVKADKQPIGNYDSVSPFTNHTIQLEKGDMIFVASDGYADQFGGPKGKKFKYKPLKKLLIGNKEKVLIDQMNLLDESFENWRGNHEQVDDVCVIGVKI